MSDKEELLSSGLETAPFSLEGTRRVAKVVSLYDGDTCKAIFRMNGTLYKWNCRLNHIDTPEMRSASSPNKAEEKKFAIRARNRLLQLILRDESIDLDAKYSKKQIEEMLHANRNLVCLDCGFFDLYGRLLVVMLDETGQENYNQILLDEGFAQEYDGGKKKEFKFS